MSKVFWLIGFMLLSSAAPAHEARGPHGGPLADIGKFYVELTIENGQLQVYLFDNATDNPVAVKEWRGTAVLLARDQKETVTLVPAGADNELTGKTSVAASAGARALVQLELADRRSMVARVAM